MKIIASSLFVAVALGAVAAYLLVSTQRPAYEAFSTVSTRVGDPGANLVGPGWTGLNRGGAESHGRTQPRT